LFAIALKNSLIEVDKDWFEELFYEIEFRELALKFTFFCPDYFNSP
jgi:hypothetical protein